MAEAAQPFDWHDHVVIGEGFTPPQRQAIEQSLNDISHFADGDGQKLLSQAQQLGGSGHKVEIVPGQVETDSNHHINVDGITPQVRINFDAQATLGVQTADGIKPMSLTATMVHEFDHLATSTTGVDKQAELTLIGQLQLSLQDPKSQAMLQHIRDSSHDSGQRESAAITDMMLHPNTYGQWLSQSGFPEAGERLAATSSIENAQALQRDNIISKYQPAAGVVRVGAAIPQAEEDAAGYTHAIIERNYGPNVAAPLHYVDAVSTQEPHTVTALPEPTQTYETQGFEPTHYSVGNLGSLPAPSVPTRTNSGPLQSHGRQ